MNFNLQYLNESKDFTIAQPYELTKVLELVNQIGQRIIPKRIGMGFTLTEERKELYLQLIYYFFNDKRFNGDLSKGLFIHGNKGTGKTIAMQVFRTLAFNNVIRTGKGFILEPCESIVLSYEIQGAQTFERFNKHSHCLEDLGAERKIALHFGTPCNVMREILLMKYRQWQETGKPTYITSNYNYELIAKEYDMRIEDRFREMFNNIVLTGKSLR